MQIHNCAHENVFFISVLIKFSKNYYMFFFTFLLETNKSRPKNNIKLTLKLNVPMKLLL